jgi:hypothetical protein
MHYQMPRRSKYNDTTTPGKKTQSHMRDVPKVQCVVTSKMSTVSPETTTFFERMFRDCAHHCQYKFYHITQTELGRDRDYERLATLFQIMKQDLCKSLVFIDGDNTTIGQREWFRKPLYFNLYQQYSITFIEMVPTKMLTGIVSKEITMKQHSRMINEIAKNRMDVEEQTRLREHTELEIQNEIEKKITINSQYERPIPTEYRNASFECIQVGFDDSGLLDHMEPSPPMDWSLDETYTVPYPNRKSLSLIGKRLFMKPQTMEWLKYMKKKTPSLRFSEADITSYIHNHMTSCPTENVPCSKAEKNSHIKCSD